MANAWLWEDGNRIGLEDGSGAFLLETGFVSDSFTDTDLTEITSHTGELGATWTVHPGLFSSSKITSNRLRFASANDQVVYASGTPATADYDVEWDMYIHPTYDRTRLGVYLRGSASAVTGYYVWYDYFNGWNIERVNAGVTTSLATNSATYADGTTTTIKASIRTVGSDAVISVYINGSSTALFSVTDTSPISTAGVVGVRAGPAAVDLTGGQHFDSFIASDVSDVAVAGRAIQFLNTRQAVRRAALH